VNRTIFKCSSGTYDFLGTYVAITSSVVGTGFIPSCPCPVVLADPTNDIAIPMSAADTIANSMVEGLFHIFNIY
jgi:hypothetical protein